jgi:hypothetical protein
MNKIGTILLALVLTVAFAIPMATPVVAHTESAPQVQTLLAGQDIEVGNVSVWNNETTLYVTYEITESPWIITETHLYAGKNVSPTTAPGQFPYSDDNATSATNTTVTYEIPLADIDSYSMEVNRKGKSTGKMVADGNPGVEPCNNVSIAAHAVVQKCETEPLTLYPELTWQRSSESNVAVYPGYGAQWNKSDGFNITLDLNTTVWDGGTGGSQYFTGYSNRSDISWASWACTQNPAGKSLTGTDLRRFQATFAIPEGYAVTGGTLGSVNPGYEDVIPMNDNIYIFVNEELIFWGGTISIAGLDPGRTHFLGMERRPTEPQNKTAFPETDGWHMDGAIPEISSSLFVEGGNVLDVFAEELWTGGGMHELGLTLQGEQTTCETETAWGNGTDFQQANWAMYFGYHIQPPPPCPFPLVGNTENISWGLRVIGPVAYPNDTPVTFTGTVNASGLQSNGAVFIGLVDKDYVDGGNSGWMGGAYIYFGRGTSSNDLRVGPTDGNFGGEIVQVFKTYTDYFSAPTDINFMMVIYNGNITVTLDSTDYVDTYGEIKALNNKTAYAWDEFEYGAYIAVDTWPYDPYGVNYVSYDVLVDWCGA